MMHSIQYATRTNVFSGRSALVCAVPDELIGEPIVCGVDGPYIKPYEENYLVIYPPLEGEEDYGPVIWVYNNYLLIRNFGTIGD